MRRRRADGRARPSPFPSFRNDEGKAAGHVIGLISGTSADGIDAAVVKLTAKGAGRPDAKVVAFVDTPFPAGLRNRILSVAGGGAVGAAEIAALDAELGEAFARAALKAAKAAKIDPSKVLAIGSHGQTVHHAPRARPRVTMQLGDPFVIAERTGIAVVSDFRRRDVAAGGEGAPLTPIAHFDLFAEKGLARAVQNLGGIGNVTVLPADAKPDGVFAFDTGPANMILDGLVRAFTSGRMRYDKNGALSARGEADETLLATLLEDPFYRAPPPKSTGRELFGRAYVKRLIDSARRRGLTHADTLATAAELTARSVANSYRRFVLPRVPVEETLLCGGGVHNLDVVARLARHLEPLGVAVKSTADQGVDPDAVEAIAFAVLAYETLRGRPGNVPRATGAVGPRVLGAIVPGR